MTELQKYSVVTLYKLGNINLEYPVVYLASEADAAFAEMYLRNINLKYQRDGLCIKIMVMEQQAEKDRDFIAAQSYGFADEIRVREEQHAEAVDFITRESEAAMTELKRQHAEEIERLKAEHLEKWRAAGEQGVRDLRDIETMMKQAERYEKLKRMSVPDFEWIRQSAFRASGPMYEAIDALVDQLPVSGEKP